MGFMGLDKVDMWRSEEMQLVQLMIAAESAHGTIEALGDVGLLQFKDLNMDKSAFQRTYANQVKRCDEMARKLRFFTDQVGKAGLAVAVRPLGDRNLSLDDLEGKLEDLEREVLEVNGNNERLARSYSELLELQLLLERAGLFFDSARYAAAAENPANLPSISSSANVAGGSSGLSREDPGVPLLAAESATSVSQEPKAVRLGFIAGLISQEKLPAFERLLFRATRGNMFLRTAGVGKVSDPATGEILEKSVFVVFFSGERARAKISKICEAFGANRYPFPEALDRQRSMLAEVTARLRELHTTIEAGDMHRHTLLSGVASNLDEWTTKVRREKGIYHTLNKLSVDASHKVLVAEAWVPICAKARVHEALRTSAENSYTQVNTILQPLVTADPPPTFYQTSKFSSCFQAIVEAYGVARYREVNPTVYTMMTFPFLFAVMFGDMGHGFLMLMFALYLIMNETKFLKQQLNEMFAMAFGGRYCILLMALFSIYMGAIYNEFFSMPMSLFGPTKWLCSVGGTVDPSIDIRDCGHAHGVVSFDISGGPYPLGVDPVWHGTKTELPFLNSMKMKMSILLGVVHMNSGIMMSWYNNTYFKDSLSTWFEFIPQMIFLNSLFGYLCLMITYKWITGSLADLYHVMIYMFLSPGSMDSQGQLFQGQGGVQVVLLLVALGAVPFMLFPKPFILKARHERSKIHTEYHVLEDHNRDEDAQGSHGYTAAPAASRAVPSQGGGGDGHGGHGEFDFSEVFVHQMIHTIEFVLGAVSNTASYLRLWALSLAHSQLSAVFYDRVLMASIAYGPAAMVVAFFVFACATLGVLMTMESLSAFLHALRLHWVEYMNKFYKGDGYAFAPFTFEHVEEA